MPDIFGPPTFLSPYDAGLTVSEANALHMLRTYSVHPPDFGGGAGIGPGEAQGVEKRTGTHTNGKSISYRHMDRKVGRLHLTLSKRGDYRVTGVREGGDVLAGSVSYDNVSPGNPVYWLPWDTAGAVIKLKIPRMGTRAHGEADPNLFFTAAINGCSIFVSGPPDAPTVYHAGGSTGMANPSDGAAFWQTMMGTFNRPFTAEVNKEDYVTNSRHYEKKTRLYTTKDAKDYMAWLKKDSSKSIEIEATAPWGCVMGIRDTTSGNWKFFLQENCTVTYLTLVKKPNKHFGSKMVREMEIDSGGVNVEKRRSISRPIRLNEIYPNRSYNARIFQSIPRFIHG